jgi:alpha-methylacyl-CoA racemase
MQPLSGVRIIEMDGIGPVPFCAMMLADAGAEVICVSPPVRLSARDPARDILSRGRKRVNIDLKSPEGMRQFRDLCRTADGLIEGYRPGVMEKLGLAPEVMFAENPKLVYGRMTGFGREGPLSQVAGHDINYIALAGALHMFGRKGEKPLAPGNLVGDFGGGGMLLAYGMTTGLLAVARGKPAHVVDCAMIDGVSLQTSLIRSLHAEGRWKDERGVNLLDTGAPFYDSYETADGKYVAVGALERHFYTALIGALGFADDPDFAVQMDESRWPAMRDKLTAKFLSRTRDGWDAVFEHVDACYAPVLSLEESPRHPQNVARGAFFEANGMVQPAAAPRFRTVGDK